MIVTGSHVTLEGWGYPPPPHPFGDPRSTHVIFCREYKGARAVARHLSQKLSAVLFWCCSVGVFSVTIFFKMVDPRMRVVDGGLRDLVNPINVHGLGNMDLNRPEERTRLEANPVYPSTERTLDLTLLRRYRQVPLTQALVNSFIYKYCCVFSDEENYLYVGQHQKQVMRRMLVRQFLPWIRNNLIDCLDESRWPLEMILFEARDDLLPSKFPKVHSGSCWQAIAQCYQRIQKMEAWVEESEEEL